MTQPPATPGQDLISEVLSRRRRSDPSATAWCASVRRAITGTTEIAAYGYTERHLGDLHTDLAKAGVRRAAGICASTPDVPQQAGRLGHQLAALRRHATATVDTRVNVLPLLDLENAAGTLYGLIQQCNGRGLGINFYDLATILGRWGNGLSPASQQVRRRIVADYYSAPDTTSN